MTSLAASRSGLEQLGYEIAHEDFFDTIRVDLGDDGAKTSSDGHCKETAICVSSGPQHRISLDETTTPDDIEVLLASSARTESCFPDDGLGNIANRESRNRKSDFLTHPVFNTHRYARPRCCAISAGSKRGTFRSATR